MADDPTSEEDSRKGGVRVCLVRSLGKYVEHRPPSWGFPQGGMGTTGSYQCVVKQHTVFLKIFNSRVFVFKHIRKICE